MGMVVGVLAGLVALGGVAAAQGSSTVDAANNAKLGQILVNAKGMTLYNFTKDSVGKSVCNGPCAKLWPPLAASGTPTLASGLPGKLGVITRADGSKQVTYNGKPLYTFAADKAAGQTNGQGFKKLWYVVHPAAAATAAAAKTTGSKLPKTGSNPLSDVAGLLLVAAGGALALRARRGRRRAA